jgi:hypothetical protein
MNDKRKIGFDVLENADEKKIKEMGADFPILTQNAKDRMLKMSKEKFNKAKGITTTENTDIHNDEYTVSGEAETYKRSAIKRIVTAAASCAAAAVLIGTTAFMLHKKPESPVVPDQNITTNADPNVTNTGTTVTGTKRNTITLTTTSQTETSKLTTVTTNVVKDFNITSPVPQSDLDRAREKVIDNVIKNYYFAYNIQYKYVDLNADGTSELIVYYNDAYSVMEIYRYDGSEYVYDINEYGQNGNAISFTSAPYISNDGKCISLKSQEGGLVFMYVTMSDDYSINIETIGNHQDWEDFEAHGTEPGYQRKDAYYHNGKKISESEYNSLREERNAIEFTEMTDFVFVAEESDLARAENQRREAKEREHEEYRKLHPHCDDYASLIIDTTYWEKLGIMDGSTNYNMYYIATYCDGTTSEEMRISPFLYWGEEYDYNILSVIVPYGENDYGPCHAKVYVAPDNEQEYFELFEIDIDFKNRSWATDDEKISDYISADFTYASDYRTPVQ